VINADREWEVWRSWLGSEPKGATVYAEVVEMLVFRKIWRGFALIYDAAPEQARKNGTFVWWLRWNYARSMGSAIRRQTEVREDVISLGRLIDRVWRYPTVLTRERFVAMQGIEDDAPMVNGWFDDLAGSGDYINPEIPAQDLEDLQERTEVVRGWVNKAVAHKDAKGRDAPPLEQLHACVDVVFELFNKYSQLIGGRSIHGDVAMTAWPVIFRTQWIADERWNELATQVERVDGTG
jgi:hypothetical protein